MLLKDINPKAADPNKDLAILDSINESSVCVEIGVFKGDLSEQILTKNPKRLYLVDPWASQIKPGYEGRLYAKEQSYMDAIHQSVVDRFKSHTNVTLHRDFSLNAVKQYADETFDWIYIDGNHDYEHAKADLIQWYPKAKKGAQVIVDDYGPGSWPQVTKAVHEFVSEYNLKLETIGEGLAQQALIIRQ